MINSEFNVFLAFILIGIIISFLFDFFRILRRVYKTPDFITIIQDIAFWIISGIILLTGIFILNEGKIRAYLFIGILAGILFYIITLSKFITNMGTKLLTVLNKIIIVPVSNIFQVILNIVVKFINSLKNRIKTIKFDFIPKKNLKK